MQRRSSTRLTTVTALTAVTASFRALLTWQEVRWVGGGGGER